MVRTWARTLVRWRDVFIAGTCLAVLVIEKATNGSGEFHEGFGVIVPVFGTAAVALAWRRAAPLLTAGAVWGIVAGHALITGTANESTGLFLIVVVANYSAGRETEGRRSLVALAIVTLGLSIHTLKSSANDDPAGLLLGAVIAMIPWFAGRSLRVRDRNAAIDETLADAVRREHEAVAKIAAAEERVHIARELHDLISHGVSVMGLQASVAEVELASNPEKAGALLQQIQQAARDTLGELQRMLGVLRDGSETVLKPLPGVDDIPELVKRLANAGLEVALDVRGQKQPITVGVSSVAYRVAQEGLTNAIKHAPGAAVVVCVEYANDAVGISVTDNGPGPKARSGNGGSGTGLEGLRERVALRGGTLRIAAAPTGGFRLQASLPVEAAL